MEGTFERRIHLAVISPSKALPEREVGNFVAGADQIIDRVEHVKVHDAKGRTGLREEHVVYGLPPETRLSGRADRISLGVAPHKTGEEQPGCCGRCFSSCIAS